jgi:hypothetical protein
MKAEDKALSSNITILFPSRYDDKKKAEECYEPEFLCARSIPRFKTALYDHDNFIEDPAADLRIYPGLEPGPCLGRTWMFKPEEYKLFYDGVQALGGTLINSPAEYDRLHLFPNVYPFIKEDTPLSLSFPDPGHMPAAVINKTFHQFIVKDYVKSVKGHDFPVFFTTPISQKALDASISRFIELRQPLFTGGIVLKEFIELKRYGKKATNEYRAFYLHNRVLTVSRNSQQPEDSSVVPQDLVDRCAHLPSRYYTVDFGERADGSFIILETGDGQVSGLSPDQNVSQYYYELLGRYQDFEGEAE